MRELRRLHGEAEFAQFALIASNAYPGTKIVSDEDRQRLAQRMLSRSEDSSNRYLGLFEGGTLLGGMRQLDFRMNLRGAKVPAGGVGFVAVDLMHKKEHVAKDMIAGFLGACQERGQYMALLYPFRPDFYRQMGFGYGTKMSRYRTRPAHLPNTGDRSRLRILTPADKPLLAACYGRFADARHGLIEKTALEIDGLFDAAENRFVGYERDGELAGYLIFTFAPERHDSFMYNNLVVEELVYEDRAALASLLTFLHTQADQIQYVVFEVQDDDFHHLMFDPRNGSQNVFASLYQETNTQGLGIMYRVLDTPALFDSLAGCDFNRETCKLKVEVRDSFVPANSRAAVLHFEGGHPRVAAGDDYEIAIALDVADFSALLMGSVGFASLYRYGQAEISDPRAVSRVDRLFRVDEPPICMTWF